MKPYFTVYNTNSDRIITHHEALEGENGAKTHAMKHAMENPGSEFIVMAPIMRVKKVDVEVKMFTREGLPEVP